MKPSAKAPEGIYRCPRCGERTSVKGKYFPFCSERCKMIDLGTWLEEGFRINGEHSDNSKDR